MRSYREEGKVRQEVLVHLGAHERPEDALAAWPAEVAHLRKIGREGQASRLEANLENGTETVEFGGFEVESEFLFFNDGVFGNNDDD